MISVLNGYNTDIGQTVLLGQMTFDPSRMPCVVLILGDDDVIAQTFNDVQMNIPFAIEGHQIARDVNDPDDTIMDIIADLKKAVFSGDKTYGGIVRPASNKPGLEYQGCAVKAREEGTSAVGGAIRISCEIVENLTDP